MKPTLRILYLEDDPRDAELVRDTLETDGIPCNVTRVETEAQFTSSLEQGVFDLILADYTLPSFDGISALKIACQRWPQVPFIFVAGTLGEDVAIEALKIGAMDYVFKTRLSRLVPSVRRALREAEERAELSRADKALQRSEVYLAEAQRLSHTGSFGWNVSTGEVYWSLETFRIFEYEPADKVTLEQALHRIHPEDRLSVQHLVDRVQKREGGPFDIEHRLLMPDGSTKYLRVVGRPSSEESGSLEYLGAVTDITERKLAEEALRHAQAELAHVARVVTLGEMTASIAHEINQPLGAVVNNASACLRWLKARNTEEARRSAELVIADGHRAGEIIARIRNLARKSLPQKDPLDINDTITEVIALARSEVEANRVFLQTCLANHLPLVLGDRIQLQQVMLNLIINGIEAINEAGEGPRELLVRSGAEESQVVLVEVRDTGPGLDPESLNDLFNAFYTTKPHGLGMGLAISRSIVEAHGGRLWATANNGWGNERGNESGNKRANERGATFQFTLPMAERPS